MIKDRPRLAEYLARWVGMQVDYAELDCARFAAGWAVECGKPDPLAAYGNWKTPRGGLKVIKANGGRLLEAVAVSLGPYEPIDELGWGAIVCADNPPLDGLGVLDGERVVCLSPLGGFKHASRAQFFAGWNM